jgi:mannose-6-phosphate isomerase
MEWHPLRLTTPLRTYISGGRAIVETLGKPGLPAWRLAETWEVSDVDGAGAVVHTGPLGGDRSVNRRSATRMTLSGAIGGGRTSRS